MREIGVGRKNVFVNAAPGSFLFPDAAILDPVTARDFADGGKDRCFVAAFAGVADEVVGHGCDVGGV